MSTPMKPPIPAAAFMVPVEAAAGFTPRSRDRITLSTRANVMTIVIQLIQTPPVAGDFAPTRRVTSRKTPAR